MVEMLFRVVAERVHFFVFTIHHLQIINIHQQKAFLTHWLSHFLQALYRQAKLNVKDVNDLQSHGAPPSEQVLLCLKELLKDAHNHVVILSGRNKQRLDAWFSGVPGLSLA